MQTKLHMGPKRQTSGCPLQKAPALDLRGWFIFLVLINPSSISAVRRQLQSSAESISHRKRELKIRFKKKFKKNEICKKFSTRTEEMRRLIGAEAAGRTRAGPPEPWEAS